MLANAPWAEYGGIAVLRVTIRKENASNVVSLVGASNSRSCAIFSMLCNRHFGVSCDLVYVLAPDEQAEQRYSAHFWWGEDFTIRGE